MLLYNSSLVLCFHIAIVVIVVVLCFVLFFHPFTVSLFSSGYCWRNDSNNVAASFVPTTIHNRDRATWERRCRREKKLLLILLCITCLLLFLLSLFIFFFSFIHIVCQSHAWRILFRIFPPLIWGVQCGANISIISCVLCLFYYYSIAADAAAYVALTAFARLQFICQFILFYISYAMVSLYFLMFSCMCV